MHRPFIDCKCSKSWTQQEFTNLREPRRGTLQDDFNGGHLELRVCVCGSCISRQIPRPIVSVHQSLADERETS